MLTFIWTSSIILSAVSLVIMCILILRRLIIHRHVEKERQERETMLNALIAFSVDGDEQQLNRIVSSVSPRVALEAGFEFLGLLRGDEHARIVAVLAGAGAIGEAVRLLRKGNEAERIHAAEMLAALGGQEAETILSQALGRDRSTEVRIAIAISLCRFGKLPPLAEALKQIGASGLRSGRLVELFRKLPAERAPELMEVAGQSSEGAFVRAAAIEALGQSDGFQLLDFLLPFGDDPVPEVSAAAIRAVGRVGHPTAGPVVERAMARHGEQSFVRAEAAEAAGRIGLPEFVEPLAGLLDDEAWPVRYAAAKALRLIVPEGEETLRKVATSEASRRQRTASLVLSEGQIA